MFSCVTLSWIIISRLRRSNFQYFWPWEEWAHVKDLPRWAPQRVFVQEVLEREVRLSYWDKIKQVYAISFLFLTNPYVN